LTFIVGEIGINWDGDLSIAEKMIKAAKECKCDAVKFQSFTESQVKDHPEKNRLVKASISKDNIEEINQLAKNSKIEWFCTPMFEDAVELLNSYVTKFKIRNFDGIQLLNNIKTPLFEKILNTDKEIIISTEMNPENCSFYSNELINWLYVVPKYPCNFTDLDFTELSKFDGYSNHCPHFLAPLMASVLGASIIEVHVTLDKNANFIDNPVSFDFNELKFLIDLIEKSKQIKN
jgi:N,N'-diacetyllegionaminate synthase